MEDSPIDRWTSSGMIAGIAFGAVGLGIAIYSFSKSKESEKMKNGAPKGAFSSLYNSKPESNDPRPFDALQKGGDMKGYKTNSKGQKTTYFNRELSEEEKTLIGDITPKKIDSTTNPSSPALCSSPQLINPSSSSAAGGSAWNQAGTWEEKNVSAWAKDNLDLQLRVTSHSSHPTKVSVTSVGTVEGDATVSMIRGKKKYLYDLNTTVRWKLESEGVVATGDLIIAEISADATHEFTVQGIDITSPGESKKSAQQLIRQHIQSAANGLQPSVAATLHSFYVDMKNKF